MIRLNTGVGVFDAESAALLERVDEAVRRKLRRVGERAVEVARETGTYHDVTGRLRSSNKYRVDGRDLVLYNDAPYAEDVEARGDVVLTTAALEAERMLNEDGDDDE